MSVSRNQPSALVVAIATRVAPGCGSAYATWAVALAYAIVPEATTPAREL